LNQGHQKNMNFYPVHSSKKVLMKYSVPWTYEKEVTPAKMKSKSILVLLRLEHGLQVLVKSAT